MGGAKAEARRRLTREAWADAALEAIAGGGVAAVAVEPIARALGATKGSFYWHFTDRDDLIRAAIARWVERQTAEPIRALGAITDPHERLVALRRLELHGDSSFDLRVEAALLADATDPRVGPVVERVLVERFAFLERLFLDMGFSRVVAHDRALLSFAGHLGRTLLRRAAPAVLPGPDGLRRHLERITRFIEAEVP